MRSPKKPLLATDSATQWVHLRLDPVVMLRPDNLETIFGLVMEHEESPTTAASFIRETVTALGAGDADAGARGCGWGSDQTLYDALQRLVEDTADDGE